MPLKIEKPHSFKGAGVGTGKVKLFKAFKGQAKYNIINRLYLTFLIVFLFTPNK
jgi:hypothetical protein